jgi:hypothetical protein
VTDQTVTSPERFVDGRERFLAGDAFRGYMSVLVVAMHTILLGTILAGQGGDIEAAFGKVGGRVILDFELSIRSPRSTDSPRRSIAARSTSASTRRGRSTRRCSSTCCCRSAECSRR